MEDNLHSENSSFDFMEAVPMAMKDATPLTPLTHEQNFFFKCKQHTIFDP